ncbi:unnamed protein product [Pieris macdunnoughi]|uniref:Retrotransposon gag domain-containing protein n=1 Tax=Pieris macdunnoughi TaxID=345717 RepID=A0A821TM60_9NEOP|nr:unnamed protein product [Pieris macdunnoughi]
MSLKTESIMKASPVNIQTLINLIPIFDTNNHDEIYGYIRSCDTVFKLSSPFERETLLTCALNNIKGIAASEVRCKTYETWDELKRFLIERFANTKTIQHLNLELQSIFQRHDESLTQFYHRVDLCRCKILEKLHSEICDSTLDGRVATTEETALSIFLNGLSTDMGIMLRTKGFDTLREAGRFAMQEDQIRAMNKARQSLFRPVATPRPAIRSNAYQNNYQSIRNPNIPFRPPNPRFSPKTCAYCKNIGHSINECRKRAYNEQNKQRALPAPIRHLNLEATNEMSDPLEIATSSYSMNPAL